jgi:hypothetical protein
MAGAVLDRVAHSLAGLLLQDGRVKKTNVLVPGNVDEQLQSMAVGHIQQPARRHIIDAQQIGPQTPEKLEIGGGLGAAGERLAFGVWGERPISDALGIKLRLVNAEELAADLGLRIRTGSRVGHGTCATRLKALASACNWAAQTTIQPTSPTKPERFISSFLTEGIVADFVPFVNLCAASAVP